MYQTLTTRLAVCLLVIAAPAGAGNRLVVGVMPYQGARALITEHHDHAAHLQAALGGQTNYAVPAPLRRVAPQEKNPAAMDVYLPATRQLLARSEESARVR